METTSLENSKKNAKKKDNKPSFKRKALENTPFTIIYNETQGYFGVMGDHRITEVKETEQEVRDELEVPNWKTLVTVIAVITEKILITKENEKLAEEYVNETMPQTTNYPKGYETGEEENN